MMRRFDKKKHIEKLNKRLNENKFSWDGTYANENINEIELDDNVYFETLSETLDEVRRKASTLGCTLDEDAVWTNFGTGGISYGQTKSATIPLLKDGQPIVGNSGKPLNRALRVAIYRMDSGRYELTVYKTW